MNIYEMSTPYLREQVRRETPHQCEGQKCIICDHILKSTKKELIEVLEYNEELREDHIMGDKPDYEEIEL